MSFEAVAERLATLQESNKQLANLIERLATLKFQPGSIPLEDEDGNVMVELKTEIQQTLTEQEEDFELLKEDVIDLPTGKPGSELAEQKAGLDEAVKRALKELKRYIPAFRKAVLSARRNLEEAKRFERELLLQSYTDPKPRSDTSSPAPGPRHWNQKSAETSKEEREINVSSDVTYALRRTHDMMASELSRSQFAHDTLKESSAALAQLGETYSTLDTLLSSSKNLLGTLLRSQKSDTWYLETAFYVLLTTIAWLVFRRFLYGPLWWFMWIPLKMFFKGWMGVFAATGLMVGGSTDVRANSVIASQSVVHNSATRVSRPSVAPRTPSINVGGGGKSGPMRPSETPQNQAGETVSEQVGRIIDESRNDQVAGEGATEAPIENAAGKDAEEEQVEAQRNPKKRMWEEDKEAAKEARRAKDEL